MHKFFFSLFIFLMFSIQSAVSMEPPFNEDESKTIRTQKTEEDRSLDIDAIDEEGKTILSKITGTQEELVETVSNIYLVKGQTDKGDIVSKRDDNFDNAIELLSKKLVGLYEEFYKKGDFHFVHLWQIDSEYVAGIDPENIRKLYLNSQTAYKEKFGKPYVYKEFWDEKIFKVSWNAHGLADDDIGGVIEDEKEWGEIAESLEDPFIAFELARTLIIGREDWDSIPSNPRADEKIAYWYNKYKTYSPSLIMGELEIQ